MDTSVMTLLPRRSTADAWPPVARFHSSPPLAALPTPGKATSYSTLHLPGA